MPTYANGRGDPCGIGSGTSDKELFHKKDAFVGVFFGFFRLLRQRQGTPNFGKH